MKFSIVKSFKRNLITGGSGFLGSHLSKQLLDKGEEVICLDNFFTGSKLNIQNFIKNPNFELIRHDVTEPIKIEVDKIWHLACPASPKYYQFNPIKTAKTSFLGTYNMLELAKKINAKFLFASSSEIYGDPDKSNVPTNEVYSGNVSSMGPRACYDESKRVGETLCYIYNNKYNLDINIIRPFNVYGPGMKQKDYRIFPNFISNILNNKKINIYGTGKQTRTYCYITDAIEGFIRVLCYGKRGEVYNIGNTDPEISVSQIFKVINKIHNKKIHSKFIKHPKSYPSDEPQRRCPDLTKAKTHLNYKPKVKLENGLINFLKWSKIHYKY